MKHLSANISRYEVGGEIILKDISLVINASDRIGVVGENGAGKTTFMKVVTGEIKEFE